jgi:hypothetical protein
MNPRAPNIRDAASLLVLRDGTRGVELLLMRRPERDNDFRSGACVFPGGVLDPAERQSHAWCLGLDDATASRRLGLPGGGLDFFIAAVRECFEEVGLLYVCRPDGSAAEIDADALDGWRGRIHADDRARFEQTLAQHLDGSEPRFEIEMRLVHKDAACATCCRAAWRCATRAAHRTAWSGWTPM